MLSLVLMRLEEGHWLEVLWPLLLLFLGANFQIDGLTDSKKLSEKKREALYAQITKKCYWASAESSSI